MLQSGGGGVFESALTGGNISLGLFKKRKKQFKQPQTCVACSILNTQENHSYA